MKKYAILLLVCIWLMIPLHSEIVTPTEGQTQVFNVLGQGFFEGYYTITATCQKIGDSYYIFTEDARVNDISISPVDPNHILIATTSGVFASFDAGVTWQAASGTGTSMIEADENNGSGADADAHRVPVNTAFYMNETQWWIGYDGGSYQTKDFGATWALKTRGLPNYLDTETQTSVYPVFYKYLWDDQVTDFAGNKDNWACTQAGLFYCANGKFIDMGAGLPQTVSDWNHLAVYDFAQNGTTAYIASELGVYKGVINMTDNMISWLPLDGDDVTIVSSSYDTTLSAVVAVLNGVELNTYVNIVDAAKSLYWAGKVEKSGDNLVVYVNDDNLYFSDDTVFDPATLDYATYDISAASAYQPANVSVTKLYLADDGNLYFIAGTEIYKLNTNLTVDLVYDAETTINDMVNYSDKMFIATDNGLYNADMTDLTTWTKLTGQFSEGSDAGTSVDYQVKTIKFDSNGNMYIGCHMGGLWRKESAGTWTNLNIGLGHRGILPSKVENVALAFDSLDVQNVIEPWFGEVPNIDNDTKQYCLIVDIDDYYYLDAGDDVTYIDGFFDPVDQLNKGENASSNEMDIIYIDSDPLDLLSSKAWAAVTNAITVEIIQTNAAIEDEWVYRGLAELGEFIVGLKDSVSAYYTLSKNNSLVTIGDITPTVKDYDYCFTFFNYLYSHYFTDAAKLLAYVSLDETGLEGINTALASLDGPSVEDVFTDYANAVFFDELGFSSIPAKYKFPYLSVKQGTVPLEWGASENSDGPYRWEIPSWSFNHFLTNGIVNGRDKSPNFSRTIVFNGEDDAFVNFDIVLKNADGSNDYDHENLVLDDTKTGIKDISAKFGSATSDFQQLYFLITIHETPDVSGTGYVIFDQSLSANEFSIGFNHNIGAPDFLNIFCYSDYQMYDDAGKAPLYDTDGNGVSDLEGPIGTLTVGDTTIALALSQFYIDVSNDNYIYSEVINVGDFYESSAAVSISLTGENINSISSSTTATGSLAKLTKTSSQNLVLNNGDINVSIAEGSVKSLQMVAAFATQGDLSKRFQCENDLSDPITEILYISSAALDKPATIRMKTQENVHSESDELIPVAFIAKNGKLTAIARATADNSGNISFTTSELGDFQVFYAKKDVLDEVVDLVPDKFALHQNFPNPFNSSTSIRYQLPKQTNVQILIFDLMGHQVKTLFQGEQNAGYYTVEWNGRSDDGRLMTSGVYFYQIISSDFQSTEKMIYLK